MLQTIREYTQGWIAGTIISLIILTFALWGIHSYFVGGVNDSVVAKVNGVPISKEQLAVRYERLRRQMQVQYGNSGNINEANLKDRALQDLIAIEVLKQASTDQGFRVSDNQVDNYLQSMPEFQVNGQFSLERFQEILSSTLLSTSDFLNLIMTSLLVDQPKLGILLSSFVTPDEASYNYALVNQERDIDYILLPAQAIVNQQVNITPAQIQTYYDEHKNDFLTPEQVNVDYVQLSLQNVASSIKPTDVMLKNFYDENINSYTQPTQWKLADIEIPVAADASPVDVQAAKAKMDAVVAELREGAPFTKAAKGYIGTLTTKGWLSLNQIPTDLQQAVSSLSKPLQTTDVIRTDKGLVVVQVIAIQEPKIQSFNNVKDRLRDSYVQQHAEEKFAEWRDQLANVSYEHPESLTATAKAMSLPIQTSDLFTRDKTGKGIAQYKKVRDVAFSDDVLNLQNNSDVIQLNPETVVVLRVNSHITPRLLPLDDVSKQIEYKLKAEELQMRVTKFAESVTAKLQSGVSPEKIATDNKLSWQHAGLLNRYSTKVDTAILDLAFRLPNPMLQKPANDVVYGAVRVPNGYAVVALKSVQPGSLTDTKQYAVFVDQGQNSQGLLEYDLYRQSQTNHSKIRITK